jgi:hypothetical protein
LQEGGARRTCPIPDALWRGKAMSTFIAAHSSYSRQRSAMVSVSIRVRTTSLTSACPILPPALRTETVTVDPGESLPTRRAWRLSSAAGSWLILRIMSPRSSCPVLYAGPPTTMLSMTVPSRIIPTWAWREYVRVMPELMPRLSEIRDCLSRCKIGHAHEVVCSGHCLYRGSSFCRVERSR